MIVLPLDEQVLALPAQQLDAQTASDEGAAGIEGSTEKKIVITIIPLHNFILVAQTSKLMLALGAVITVLTLESVDETLRCDHSDEHY